MKCSYCGSELKERTLYCDNCGKEVQMVPDYNAFEEDYLNRVLFEGEASEDEENLAMEDAEQRRREERINRNRKQRELERQKALKKKKAVMIGSIVAVAIVVIFIIVLVVKITTDRNHESSYTYQFEQGKIAEKQNDIPKAIGFYENAAALDKDDMIVRYVLAGLYLKEKDYNKAIVTCSEILAKDDTEFQAYEMLLQALEANKDFDAIKELSAKIPDDDNIRNLFSKYLVVAPTANYETGSYEEFIDVELSGASDVTIYYTDNGDDPKGSTAKKYTEPISLKDTGKYKIKAVAVNAKGIYSETVTFTYDIDLAAPVTPFFTTEEEAFDLEKKPIPGAFYIGSIKKESTDPVDPGNTDPGNTEQVKEEKVIVINVPENCKAYYEWNKETPSIASAQYDPMSGIPMMEGNNILYIIFIDERNEKCSAIKSKPLEYFPE